ncbi:MAG: hypothetical protein ACD_26C00034G0104 [uncultured bacterium]|nr:MAG: hypothetical protein ACD_26C00034G0104 [uncultured bacterium]
MKHLPHYISLIGILMAGLLGFYFFSYDRFFQIGIAVALAASYVSWGVIHHTIHKDICLAIILEYVAVAILGVVMVFSLILRS